MCCVLLGRMLIWNCRHHILTFIKWRMICSWFVRQRGSNLNHMFTAIWKSEYVKHVVWWESAYLFIHVGRDLKNVSFEQFLSLNIMVIRTCPTLQGCFVVYCTVELYSSGRWLSGSVWPFGYTFSCCKCTVSSYGLNFPPIYQIHSIRNCVLFYWWVIYKGKAIPLRALAGPEGFRM
jgi:hypothetical protein